MNGLDEEKIKASGGDGGGKWYSSFLDKKRKALNLLGSVRRSTRERDKDLGRVSYAETLRNSAASSPVSGRRSRSGSDPHNHLMAVRPAGLQTSTGFTPRDELSSSLTVPPTTAAVAYPVSQYGSWTNLRTADYDRLDEDFVFKQVRSIRKVKSLPRSVLCSPVTSRKTTSQSVGHGHYRQHFVLDQFISSISYYTSKWQQGGLYCLSLLSIYCGARQRQWSNTVPQR